MPEEKTIFKEVVLDGCPVEWLDSSSKDLFTSLVEHSGEPPSLEEAYRVGLITGGAHVMDVIGIAHDYKEFTLVPDLEKLDS